MAQKIAVDGTATEFSPGNGKSFTLEEIYRIVECDTFQEIRLSNGRYMLMDEDGKAHMEKGENWFATALALDVLIPGDVIIGPVLVGDDSEFD